MIDAAIVNPQYVLAKGLRYLSMKLENQMVNIDQPLVTSD